MFCGEGENGSSSTDVLFGAVYGHGNSVLEPDLYQHAWDVCFEIGHEQPHEPHSSGLAAAGRTYAGTVDHMSEEGSTRRGCPMRGCGQYHGYPTDGPADPWSGICSSAISQLPLRTTPRTFGHDLDTPRPVGKVFGCPQYASRPRHFGPCVAAHRGGI